MTGRPTPQPLPDGEVHGSAARRAPEGRQAAGVLLLGAVAVTTAVAARRWPGLLAVSGACWVAALVLFSSMGTVGEPVAADRTSRRGLQVVSLGRRWLVLLAPLGASLAAARWWALVPVALGAWVLAARQLGARWTYLLVAGVGAVAAAAAAVALGAPRAAEDLALLGYAIASVACGLALLRPVGEEGRPRAPGSTTAGAMAPPSPPSSPSDS